MRIISGSLRRRTIQVPPGRDVRPTTDKIREAIFNLLVGRVDLVSARVLDLFAGSGALGLEAISRGASDVVFVEKNARIAGYVGKNAAALDVESQSTVVVGDAIRFLERYDGPPFDVVLADPPYAFDEVMRLPDAALRIVRPEGLLIFEHDGRLDFGDHACLLTQRSYGRTKVSLFMPSYNKPKSG